GPRRGSTRPRGRSLRTPPAHGPRVMSAILPIQRVRLELDHTLRTRSFIARAIQGCLDDAALGDLGAQLASLVSTVTESVGDTPPVVVAPKDAGRPCAAVRVFGIAA